jgi:DNA processing protein
MITFDDPRLARAALSWLVEPGNLWVAHQLATAGPVSTAERCLNDTEGRCPLYGRVAALTATQRFGEIRRLLDEAEAQGIRFVVPGDRQWPTWIERVTALPEAASLGRAAPVCLWVRGTRPVGETLATAVTVTGARAASDYGTHVASGICQDLAQHGCTVLAGCGFGIDAAALRSTLVTDGGIPVALAARGLDLFYPAGNAQLLAGVAERGLVLSVYPLGQRPYRQRITTTGVLLAALGRAVVVVEAAARSGALTSLHTAAALGQPALVVPGPVTSVMSAGCHTALREHPDYRLVTCAADILTDLATGS